MGLGSLLKSLGFGHKQSDFLENVKYLAAALNAGNYDFVMTFLELIVKT